MSSPGNGHSRSDSAGSGTVYTLDPLHQTPDYLSSTKAPARTGLPLNSNKPRVVGVLETPNPSDAVQMSALTSGDSGDHDDDSATLHSSHASNDPLLSKKASKDSMQVKRSAVQFVNVGRQDADSKAVGPTVVDAESLVQEPKHSPMGADHQGHRRGVRSRDFFDADDSIASALPKNEQDESAESLSRLEVHIKESKDEVEAHTAAIAAHTKALESLTQAYAADEDDMRDQTTLDDIKAMTKGMHELARNLESLEDKLADRFEVGIQRLADVLGMQTYLAQNVRLSVARSDNTL